MSLNLTVFRSSDVFTELKGEWDDLLERSATGSIFSTWLWNSTWWDVYQPGDLWIVTCRDMNGRLVGLAPWFITAGSEPVLQTIGCREVADYLDVLVDHDMQQSVLEHIARFLGEHKTDFDNIALCNIPEHSIGNTVFPAKLEQYGFTVTVEPEDVCPIIPLPRSWEDYLQQLDKRNRHELRRKIRRSQGNNLETDWYIVGEEHDLEVEMERFLQLMASSDPEKAEFCADPNNQEFFRRIAAQALEAGWLMLNMLTINGVHAAAYFNFDYKGHILVYNSGLNPEYASLSPGIVLLAHGIRYAIDCGRSVYDFLQGNEEYKYRMGGKDTGVVTLLARASEA